MLHSSAGDKILLFLCIKQIIQGREASLVPKGALYAFVLLLELTASGQICSIGHHWYGALALADVVILLACCQFNSLQEMIRICEEHAKQYELTFSTDLKKFKTGCLAFNDKD